MVPLGRHHPGHHRHRDGHADPRQRSRWSSRTSTPSRTALAALAQDIATRRWRRAAICSRRCRSPSATSGRPPRRLRAPPAAAAATCARAFWWASSAAPPATCRRSAQDGLRGPGGLMRRNSGSAQPEIAWHTMRDRIAEVGCFLGLVTGSSARSRLRREADDADRGRGGLRAIRTRAAARPSTMPQKRNPISCVYITAATARGAPAGGGAARRHGRGPRARDRPMGDRVDRRCRKSSAARAGCLAQTRFCVEWLAGRREKDARPISTSPRG